jgi:hypothetical protein
MNAKKLKNLQVQIGKLHAQKLAKKKKEKEEERKEREEEKRRREAEDKLLPKKRELLRKMLGWAKEFLKTDLSKQLFAKTNEPITIFYANFSKVSLDKKGNLIFGQWCKYGGLGAHKITEKVMRKLTYNYLKEVYEAMESDKVLDTIARELKDRVEWDE